MPEMLSFYALFGKQGAKGLPVSFKQGKVIFSECQKAVGFHAAEFGGHGAFVHRKKFR
jgi:hypothetical protein